MLLLIVSQFFGRQHFGRVPALLVATVESSVLVLNALLGRARRSLRCSSRSSSGWASVGSSSTSAILLTALVLASLGLPLRAGARRAARAAGAATGIPRRFWMYAAFAVLYGFCETVNGNWSQLDMTSELGASTTEAAIVLTVFWAMVTIGCVVFAAVDRWLAVRTTYHVLPFLLAGILWSSPFCPTVLLPAALWLSGGGPLVFGPAAVDDWIRRERAFGDCRRSGRWRHRVLPARLRDRRVRPRPTALDNGTKLSTIYGISAAVAVAKGIASFGVHDRRP